jgi:hypothetical protein
MDFQKDRHRNPGLRKFLAWQDAFTHTLKVESPALEPGAMLALAPSQKVDFSGIESAPAEKEVSK